MERRVLVSASGLAQRIPARGSFDWPSQNMACLHTSRLRFVLATAMSFDTPSSFGICFSYPQAKGFNDNARVSWAGSHSFSATI